MGMEIGDTHLELCANRHVVAKILLHPVNLLSVGIHDRGKGHKVCPDSAFQVEKKVK